MTIGVPELVASFSSKYPVAYHVLPLPAWRGIVRERALLAAPADGFRRPTTAAVDRTLGFDRFVHLYLAQGSHGLHGLPILQAQLQVAQSPPFPHMVLELATRGLNDAEVVICNWNLAVSRPGVPGVVKGGNWTRGTDPGRIREVWDAFRETAPGVHRARGFFHPGCAVPILRGEEVARHRDLLSRAPRRMPELLLEDRVELSRFERLLVFSDFDCEVARRIAPDFPIRREVFPGYDVTSVPTEIRTRLERYVMGGEVDNAWNFDGVRAR